MARWSTNPASGCNCQPIIFVQRYVRAVIALLAWGIMAYGADLAVISDSGSTNTDGFRIAVERSGRATYTSVPRRNEEGKTTTRSLPSDLVRRLYEDLDSAQPFSGLPR